MHAGPCAGALEAAFINPTLVMIFQYSACFGTDPRLLSLCFPSTFSAILAAIGAHPCNLAFKRVYLSLFVCVCMCYKLAKSA